MTWKGIGTVGDRSKDKWPMGAPSGLPETLRRALARACRPFARPPSRRARTAERAFLRAAPTSVPPCRLATVRPFRAGPLGNPEGHEEFSPPERVFFAPKAAPWQALAVGLVWEARDHGAAR